MLRRRDEALRCSQQPFVTTTMVYAFLSAVVPALVVPAPSLATSASVIGRVRAPAAVMDEASRGVLLRGLLDEAIAAGSGRVTAEPPGAMGLSGAAPPVSMELSSTKKKRRKKMNKHKLRKRRRKNRNKNRPA